MKIRKCLICILLLVFENSYGQHANYKAQLNRKLHSDIYLKKEIKYDKKEDTNQLQSPKYRKRKARIIWTDSSKIKHQSYKQQTRPK